ncbi:2-isopropylmalate synthase [Gilvimarinus sp. SDUM040013]|uniref:2-isopropylmalate synthase n=1 Tax=Gilvimarinus gilvus TaxID=3058038 RepID=A0ABU4RZ37_9GAMM|nr:2-isopropylmalate synthase [Gilvimarinus sp. SDUM040013]MDO3387701.1 2-isopropylmalate synthase [Gilvimarinus sp. SDUM040013]MDX6848858.1 2-isopropylmalate synthase [Gilvimarinus sp. SDUM040013]
MLKQPSQKYQAFRPVALPERQWPNRAIEQPPIWMSTDLRDGNQALIDPMSVATKLKFFKALVAMGFKEIEVGFPSASATDFEFVRLLIEQDHIPADVTIEVLTQAREELINRTVESVQGAHRAIVHMYNPTAPDFREIVYRTDQDGVKAIAEQGTHWVKQAVAQYPNTEWVYQYSPEVFSSTELEFAKEVVDAVSAIWQPTADHKMIVNLPATVEMSTPNTYADQIEWMHRHIARRESITLSVHPHNDRGTAVAAAELAIMAGADRVEGCLFGNGERTGNVDLVTLALNMYTQGVAPGLDFSRIDEVRQLVEQCNKIPVHPRHPYAGELVFTAFSGSHQDAIKKGFAVRREGEHWRVPYLPIDPKDLGRDYESVVRVNSQSGKGGISFLLAQEYGLDIPRRLQIEFSRIVQAHTDSTGKEARSADIFALFESEYLQRPNELAYKNIEQHSTDESVTLAVDVDFKGNTERLFGQGSGPIAAAVAALADRLGVDIQVVDYHEHAIQGGGALGEAVGYIELKISDQPPVFGVGRDKSIVAAAVRALLNGISRSQALTVDGSQRDQVG